MHEVFGKFVREMGLGVWELLGLGLELEMEREEMAKEGETGV